MRTTLVAFILCIAPMAFSAEVGTPDELNIAITSIAGSESIVLTTSITDSDERNWEINVGDPNTHSVTIDTNGNTLTMEDNWTIKGPDTTTTYLNGTFIAKGTEFGLLGGTYIFTPSSYVQVEGSANLFVDADGGNVAFDNSFMSAINLTIGGAFNPEVGSLNVTNGGRVAVDTVGVVEGMGSMTIAGAGSQARFGQELNVGQGGAVGTSASFSVLDGGSVTVAGGLRISPEYSNQGHVLVAGAGSLLSLTGTLSGSPGGSADGSLVVQDGGVVRLTGENTGSNNFAIAMAGTATIGDGGRMEMLSGPGGEPLVLPYPTVRLDPLPSARAGFFAPKQVALKVTVLILRLAPYLKSTLTERRLIALLPIPPVSVSIRQHFWMCALPTMPSISSMPRPLNMSLWKRSGSFLPTHF